MVLKGEFFIILRRHFLAKIFVTALAFSFFSGCGQDTKAPLSSDEKSPAETQEPQSRQRVKIDQGGIREISFDDIVFEMEEDTPFSQKLLPERVTSFVGQQIRIRGYILPSFQQTGLTQFVLVRDNMECCFGPGAALYDCVVVKMLPGRTAEFSIRPVAVTGTFGIKELKGRRRKPPGCLLAHGRICSMIGLRKTMLSIVLVLSDTVFHSVCATLFLLSTLTSTSSACPFCGPVETPLSYGIARSSDLAIGESLTEAVANRQGQRRQPFHFFREYSPHL